MPLPAAEIGRRIKEVRQETGVTVSTLAAALGVEPDVVGLIESGQLDPLPGDYVLIAARLLKTDFRYFVSDTLDDVERQTRRVFRALSNPTPSDLLAIRRFISLCMNEAELEAMLAISREPLPPRHPMSEDARLLHKDHGPLVARSERLRLLLGNLPLPNVFHLIRGQGIRLFRHRLRDAQLSGVTVLHPRAGVCILINYDEDLYRQFFSAAHEYAHVLFDRSTLEGNGHIISYRYSEAELIELRANAFAAEFLLPMAALERYQQPRDITGVTTLLRRVALDYRVNTATVAIRFREHGWITQRTLDSFLRATPRPVVVHRGEKLDPDVPDDLTATQKDRRMLAAEQGFTTYYLELLRSALTQDVITPGRFAEMLDMDVTQARDFASSVGLAL